MKIDNLSALLPFGREQIFDLAADIERYPEFLPGWNSARIVKSEATVLHVEQVVGIGPLRIRFRSRAVLQRPERIDVSSFEPPFRYYNLTWLVEPRTAESCSLRVMADMELRSRLLQHAVELVLPAVIGNVMTAFEARANKLYTRLL